jgi:uncharacterized membrane protein YidH (DUF202 family)
MPLSPFINPLFHFYHPLANERTFLAWLRTSLSLITVGVGKVVIRDIFTLVIDPFFSY